jgi:hypothetical protein
MWSENKTLVGALLLTAFLIQNFSFSCRKHLITGKLLRKWYFCVIVGKGILLFTGFVVSSLCDTELTATYLAMGSFLPILMLCGEYIIQQRTHNLLFCSPPKSFID